MDVLIALGARPVPDRDPGGGCEGLSFETQCHHETGGDLPPLLVDEGSIPGRERQRDMPDVAPGRVFSVRVVGGIERCPEVGNLFGDLQGDVLEIGRASCRERVSRCV